jgi:xanthine dehydrogenase large subunit
VVLASRCGYSTDYSGPVNDRAILHIDNCYYLPNLHIVGHRCKTNMQSATAFRGFGGPQGMFGIETVIETLPTSWARTRWMCAASTCTRIRRSAATRAP